MKIKFLLENLTNPNTYLYLERYVNEGSRTYSLISSQSEGALQYQPTSSTQSFDVICVEIPKEKIVIYLDNPDTELYRHYINEESVLFPVHPEIFADRSVPFVNELKNYPTKLIKVSPTASTRTVMTLDNDNIPLHYIKLHYPRRISRFIRKLNGNIIAKSVNISADLNIALPNFVYLPEAIGLAYGVGPDSWGFIAREFNPRPQGDKESLRLPLFSLYARDINNPKDLPLLIQIIEFLKVDPMHFILKHIMEPLIKAWCTVLAHRGIVLEMHGQNTLIEFDKNLSSSRLIYRDLDAYVDMRTRQQLGLKTDGSMQEKRQMHYVFSLRYDAFIGHHLFDYITEMVKKYYKINPEKLQKICKELFHQYLPNAHMYFNKKTYYYSNKMLSNNNWKIVETTAPPKWR